MFRCQYRALDESAKYIHPEVVERDNASESTRIKRSKDDGRVTAKYLVGILPCRREAYPPATKALRSDQGCAFARPGLDTGCAGPPLLKLYHNATKLQDDCPEVNDLAPSVGL
jgi:hypothetical protein